MPGSSEGNNSLASHSSCDKNFQVSCQKSSFKQNQLKYHLQELKFEHSKTDSEKSTKQEDPPLIVTIPPSIDQEILLPKEPRSAKQKTTHVSGSSQVTAELRTEYLSFREKFVYGTSESTITGPSTKGKTGKSHELDLFVIHPCSCFSFLNIFNKQKCQ